MIEQNQGFLVQEIISKAIFQYAQNHNSQSWKKYAAKLDTIFDNNPQKLYETFGSSLQKGLTSQMVLRNKQKYGDNLSKLQKKKLLTYLNFFKQAALNKMMIVLIIPTLISIVIQYIFSQERDAYWIDGVSVLVGIVLCALVTAAQKYFKQYQFQYFYSTNELANNYVVLREGEKINIKKYEIVPGDMLVLFAGMKIPADCILCQYSHAIVNEKAISGKDNNIQKNGYTNLKFIKNPRKRTNSLMISGMTVKNGKGLMMAIIVGDRNYYRQRLKPNYPKQVNILQSKTSLQALMLKLDKTIAKGGIFFAFLTFVVLIIHLIIQQVHSKYIKIGQNLQNIFSYLLNVLVISAPDLLPLNITIASSVKQIYKNNILIKRLRSCQAMGTLSYICLDQVGIVVQNVPKITHFFNKQLTHIKTFHKNNMSKQYFNRIIMGMVAIADSQELSSVSKALILLVQDLTKKTYIQLRSQIKNNYLFKKYHIQQKSNKIQIYIKLNDLIIVFFSELNLQNMKSYQYYQSYYNNYINRLNQQMKQETLNQLKNYQKIGCKTVSISYKIINIREIQQYKNIKIQQNNSTQNNIKNNGYILLNIFIIKHEIKPYCGKYIKQIQRAGIRIILTTQNNNQVASYIGKQIGLIQQNQNDRIIKSQQLIEMLQNSYLLQKQQTDKNVKQIDDNKQQNGQISEEEEQIQSNNNKVGRIKIQKQDDKQQLKQILDKISIVTRCGAQHKYILVDGIRELGWVVAVTAHQVGDVETLLRADVGIGMSVNGVQAVKSAADVILLQQDVKTIVKGIVWGRKIHASVRKFIQFQVTANLVAIIISFVTAALIKQTAFTPVQMLWFSLIIDSLAILALVTEPLNHQKQLNQRHSISNNKIFTKIMFKHITAQIIFQTIILLWLIFIGYHYIPEHKDQFDQIIGYDLYAKYQNGYTESTVADGKFYTIQGQQQYKIWFNKYHNHSRHFTFVYNTFVFLQIFNLFCCRKINDQINIFRYIWEGRLFWLIIFIVVCSEVFIITFGGRFFQIYRFHGLSPVQWLISVLIGALVIPFSFILRVIPFGKHQ